MRAVKCPEVWIQYSPL